MSGDGVQADSAALEAMAREVQSGISEIELFTTQATQTVTRTRQGYQTDQSAVAFEEKAKEVVAAAQQQNQRLKTMKEALAAVRSGLGETDSSLTQNVNNIQPR